jgi:phage-related holin
MPDNTTVDWIITGLIGVVSGVLSFLGLSSQQIMILAALMALDFISGIAKAYRIERTSVTSYNMGVGIIGKMLYLLIPLVVALALKGTALDGGSVWLLTFTVNALILAETYSIIANVYMFKTKKVITEIDGVSYLLRFIKLYLDKLTVIK